MARTVGIGIQSFEKLITEHCFYIDKTDFIREWWENKDDVDCPPPAFWENVKYEYAGTLFFDRVCGPGLGV